ncbi:MAG TPA: glycosyltransferase family 1 protein [Candidatus Paceibacterota bacterium]
MNQKIKVALMADAFDRRPERAFFARRLIERLVHHPDIELFLIHFDPMPNEPLYKEAHEILIPRISLPWGSRFVSFIWYCFTTREQFDIFQYLVGRPYPFFWLMPAKRFVVLAHDAGVGRVKGTRTIPNLIFYTVLRFFNRYIDAIVGVSEYARKDIQNVYHLLESKTASIYVGVDPMYRPVDSETTATALRKYNIGASKYIFYLGGLNPHKNVPNLIRAYTLLRQAVPALQEKLLIADLPSHGSGETYRAITESPYSRDIICAGRIELGDIPALHSGATVFVFPSLHEGFGMPPLEAMACGTPTVVSNATSLPEVTGGASILVDALDVQEITSAMRRVIESPELKRQLREKGIAQAKKFTWDAFADKHIGLYKRLLAGSQD